MTLPQAWVDDVLSFWFEETKPKQWFEKSDAFDAEVRRRFEDLHGKVAATDPGVLTRDARTALAAIVVLDQMSRNMYRGTPRAFAQDLKALALAETVVARGFDRPLTKDERMFCYLPFEHAESPEAQARCVALTAELDDPELMKWAEAHKAVIDRFGRFPHRNAILGRETTSEEAEFLKQPGSSF